MSNPRKAVPSLSFNGKNVTTKLKEFLESVSYTDVASGDSDSIDISLHNIGMKWMGAWYPKKGDKISGSITFQNWNAEGKHLKLDCGKFVLDSIKFSGGPLKATFGALAIPASESFKSRERTKTSGDTQGIERIDSQIKALILSMVGTIPGSRGFGLEREFISRPPQEALNLLAIELEEKLEEYIPEVTVANAEGKVNGDGSIEPTIYIERRN